MKFSTRAIHIGSEPDAETGAMMPPIYMTSTYAQESPGTNKGYDYTRAGNPNFSRLEKALASLEGGRHATVFSSGMGALTAMISTLSKGDSVVTVGGLYGGSYRLFHQVFNRFGINCIGVASSKYDEIESVIKANKPKWVFFESPTNPLLEINDIEALAKIAKRNEALTIVDNTFASPCCQNPLKWGADIVWHSTTKYIGGHSDILGGGSYHQR